MKLEILRTYVVLKANNHNIKPTNATVGGFSICLDDVAIEYDNFDFYGKWDNDCNKNASTIEWTCKGGSDVYKVNNKDIDDTHYHQFDNFEKLPSITSISEISYEAYSNIIEDAGYEFYPTTFAILVIDRDTNKEYEIEASQEVLDAYINKMIIEGELTKALA